MMVITFPDTAVELRLLVKHNLTGVVVEADSDGEGEQPVMPLSTS
ncbi:hypothetical protein [Methylobacterium crusticola]|nr:hypothetical protein [Methylobacterium crusticola]